MSSERREAGGGRTTGRSYRLEEGKEKDGEKTQDKISQKQGVLTAEQLNEEAQT